MRIAYLTAALVGVTSACSSDDRGMGGIDGPEGSIIDARPPVDADPCSEPGTPSRLQGCRTNGLTGLSLDGMWNLEGTLRRFGATMPYSSVRYMKRTGSGRCAFALSIAPITGEPRSSLTIIDDTSASYLESGSYPHAHTHDWTMCMRDSDGALIYQQRDYVSMPGQDDFIDGVLTRSP